MDESKVDELLHAQILEGEHLAQIISKLISDHVDKKGGIAPATAFQMLAATLANGIVNFKANENIAHDDTLQKIIEMVKILLDELKSEENTIQ